MISLSTNMPGRGFRPPFPGDHRILFGHQSVGTDLLRGIRALSDSAKIFELDSDRRPRRGSAIFHFKIGTNGDPYSKIDDFASYVMSHQTHYDIAAMKLCYADIDRHTDIDKLFQHYRHMVDRLFHTAPNLRLVHITVPLRSVKLGVRSHIRLLTRGAIDALEDNLQRDAYNSLIRAGFGGRPAVFDLASIEMTQPNGDACTRQYKQGEVPCLFTGFTHDGGHLNSIGAETIAGEFITLIGDM